MFPHCPVPYENSRDVLKAMVAGDQENGLDFWLDSRFCFSHMREIEHLIAVSEWSFGPAWWRVGRVSHIGRIHQHRIGTGKPCVDF